MDKLVLEFNERSRYELTLTSKITVIAGDSAGGKTTLLREIYDKPYWQELYPDMLALRASFSKIDMENILRESSPGKFVVVDEDDIKKVRSNKQLVKLNTINCNSIVFSRSPLWDLMYSYADVYYLKEVDGVIRNVRLFDDLLSLPTRNNVIVEDSGSGLEYFAKWLSYETIESMHGNTSVLSNYQDCSIISDGAVLGPLITFIRDKLYLYEIFAPVSFEYLIERYFDNKYKKDFYKEVPLVFKSLERYFTSLVQKRFSDYSKKRCPIEVMIVDLLEDFKGCISGDVNVTDTSRTDDEALFSKYCALFGIIDKESERKRLASVYGTYDFYQYLASDFGV